MAYSGSVDTIYPYAVLTYRCSFCGSKPGNKCIAKDGRIMSKKMHHARLQSHTGVALFGVKL